MADDKPKPPPPPLLEDCHHDLFGREYLQLPGVRMRTQLDQQLQPPTYMEHVLTEKWASYDMVLEKLLRLEWQPADPPAFDSSKMFSVRVVMWNVLAQYLSSGPHIPQPIATGTESNAYGGFSEVEKPELVFDPSARKWRIAQALVRADADIIGLAEVDFCPNFLGEVLRQKGFHYRFCPKMNAPGLKFGGYSDGCVVAWRTSKFELMMAWSGSFAVGSGQIWLVVVLRHIQTQRPVVITCTHLKSKPGEETETVRVAQVEEVMAHVREGQEVVAKMMMIVDPNDVPTIFMGDLNAQRFSDLGHAVQAVTDRDITPNSVYDLDDRSWWTTLKSRKGHAVKRAIDHIFYNNAPMLTLRARMKAPPEGALPPWGLPSQAWPSDHIMLGADFVMGPMDSITKWDNLISETRHCNSVGV